MLHWVRVWILFLVASSALGAEPAPRMLEVFARGEARPIAESEIRQRIREAAREPGRFLSLGETHLLPTLNQAYLRSLAEEWFGSAQEPVHTCVESLPRATDLFAWLKGVSESFLVTTGNGPGRTDFMACSDPTRRWMLYSGLFHQYPFARVFPKDFPATPVSELPGNTISTQLVGLSGLYVASFDLMYLESLTSESLLREGILDPALFAERAAELELAVRAVIRKMGPISTRLHGAYFGKESIPGEVAREVIPDGAHLLVTDPDYRVVRGERLMLLTRISGRPELLSKLLAAIAPEPRKLQFAGMFDHLDPVTEQPGRFRFGSLPGDFAPATQFLILNGSPLVRYIVASPDHAGLRCFTMLYEVGFEAEEVACGNLF